MNFQQRLIALRGDLSQVEAAKRAGISQQMWGKLEQGKTKPENSVAVSKIARAFGLSTEELVSGFSLEIREPLAAYGGASSAPMDSATQERMIERAQNLWDTALRTNRRLAAVIANIIIIVASSGLLKELESPSR
ncbi:helix-turn-helix transcriptional regulator [Nevskia sp.]|uniref:helix-turn-helix transcriptional regulator n=1 Tax=Nevskia sp. TaxID=1929292 RepID=UPI0025E4F1EB|nr:helix-turn-helix transcriptional regulator [Nevskia sp.]